MFEYVPLPSGDNFILRMEYTTPEVNGVKVLIAASCLSMIAVCGLLIVISLSAFNTRKSLDKTLFVRTHVAAYFVSLLLCDLLQAIGSIMNQKWVQHMEVYVGEFCTIQGATKQAADVGTALFSLILAIHTFSILFLRWQMRTYVLWLTLLSAWSGIAAIVIAGPAALDTHRRGPFFGISGYWCWITEPYSAEHVTLDYMFMFISALFSFILYSLVFLRLRGNIVVDGWYITFRRTSQSKNASWSGRDFADNQIMTIARQMLLYPVAYTIIILPIAVARFNVFAGHSVPFAVTIFCDTVFLLSGMVNVVLFTATRRVLPPRSIMPGRYIISQPKLIETSLENDPDAYYRSHPTDKAMDDGSTSIFKRSDSYASDTGSNLSIPNEHDKEIVSDVAYVQSPVTARPEHQFARESIESTYDLYAESTYRRSSMPRITEDGYHHSQETQDSRLPSMSLSDISLDENYDR